MDKLKGTERLSRKIQASIQHNIGLIVKTEIDNAFLWYHAENTLCFTPYTFEEIDKNWSSWINETFKTDFPYCSIYYLSFLHELGHKITLPNVTDEEFFEGQDLAKSKNHVAYWSCYREYIATKWAVDFILNHEQEFENFAFEVEKALRQFYKINNIFQN